MADLDQTPQALIWRQISPKTSLKRRMPAMPPPDCRCVGILYTV
jgi:hypothetical protein